MANVKKSDWLKKLTSRNDANEDEDYDGDDKDSENGVEDVLTVLNVDLQTQIPEGVKTSAQMSGVQFRVAKPKGYFFDDVDAALDAAIDSMKTYEKLLHKRDLDVHKLATEIDRKNTDYSNLQFQLEATRAKGKVVTDEDGRPVVVTGEVEVMDYNSLKSQHEKLLLNQQELEVWVSGAQPYIEQLEAKVAELEESESRTEAIPLPGATDNASSEDTEKDLIITSLEQQIAELQGQLQQSQSMTQESATSTAPASQELTSEERQQFQALQGWAEEVQVKYSQMESYVAELEAMNETSQQQVQELQSSLESAQADLHNVQESLVIVQGQVVDIAPYEAEVQAAQERATELESEIEQRDNYIAELSAWAEEVQQQMAAEPENVPEEAQEEDYPQYEEPVMQTQEQPTPQEHPESDEDAFTRALTELNDPELGENAPRRPARSTGNYKKAAPGSPLTSLPPGANIDDYL